MVRSVAGNLPEQVKNNQSVNTAAGNGGQKMSQYSWFTVYSGKKDDFVTIIEKRQGESSPTLSAIYQQVFITVTDS